MAVDVVVVVIVAATVLVVGWLALKLVEVGLGQKVVAEG